MSPPPGYWTWRRVWFCHLVPLSAFVLRIALAYGVYHFVTKYW